MGERLKRYMHHRKINAGEDGSFAGSIDAAEQHLQKLKSVAGDPSDAQHMSKIDAYYHIEKIDKTNVQLMPQITAFENILNRVRQSVHDYLVEAESELLTGQTESTLFTRGEAYVVNRLHEEHLAGARAQRRTGRLSGDGC
ncbi:hypothetical protein [Arthrobacter sp. TMS1-12-1]